MFLFMIANTIMLFMYASCDTHADRNENAGRISTTHFRLKLGKPLDNYLIYTLTSIK
jgi:hypothetical protein